MENLVELTIGLLGKTAFLLKSGATRFQNERSTRFHSKQEARKWTVAYI